MKTWTNPELEELEVELTAGGCDRFKHEKWGHNNNNCNPNPNPNPDEEDPNVPEIPEIDEDGTPS